MVVTVKLKYLRIAPRKVRLVADLIRGKSADEAEDILEWTRKKAAKPLKKLLKSATAAAEHNFQKERSNLYISKITVDEGPTLKRSRFRGFGRIFPIMKRTSHVTLVLDEIEPEKKTKKAKKVARAKEEKKKRKLEKPREEKPKPRTAIPRPKFGKTVRKFFRRKAF